jgi:exo-beta-1,3-glucanase (GH17 family)
LLDKLHAEAPQLALATTEPFQMFEAPEAAPILQRLDFMLANVHPIFQPWFHDAPEGSAVQFVVNVTGDLGRYYCGPILVKETGIPTAPEQKGFTEQKQASFYEELGRRFRASGSGSGSTPGAPPRLGSAASDRAFAYFSAFDAPWRVSDGEAEAHFGLFDEKRRPKPVVALIPPLTSRSLPPHHE